MFLAFLYFLYTWVSSTSFQDTWLTFTFYICYYIFLIIGLIQTRTICSRTIFVLSKSYVMNISSAWNAYVYTALYLWVFVFIWCSKNVHELVLCWQCGFVDIGNFTPPKNQSLYSSCHSFTPAQLLSCEHNHSDNSFHYCKQFLNHFNGNYCYIFSYLFLNSQ